MRHHPLFDMHTGLSPDGEWFAVLVVGGIEFRQHVETREDAKAVIAATKYVLENEVGVLFEDIPNERAQ